MIWGIGLLSAMMIMWWIKEIPFTCEKLQKESERGIDMVLLPVAMRENERKERQQSIEESKSLWWRMQYHLFEEISQETQRMNMSICTATLAQIKELLEKPLFTVSASVLLILMILPFVTILLYIPWVMVMVIIVLFLLKHNIYKTRQTIKKSMDRD
jgi:hypothetical protein